MLSGGLQLHSDQTRWAYRVDVKASGSPAHVPVRLPICRLGDVLRPTHGKPGKGQSGGER